METLVIVTCVYCGVLCALETWGRKSVSNSTFDIFLRQVVFYKLISKLNVTHKLIHLQYN